MFTCVCRKNNREGHVEKSFLWIAGLLVRFLTLPSYNGERFNGFFIKNFGKYWQNVVLTSSPFHDGGRYHIETSPLICGTNRNQFIDLRSTLLGYIFGCGWWWWIYFGCRWVVVDSGGYILAGGGWWWINFGWWWLVVDGGG